MGAMDTKQVSIQKLIPWAQKKFNQYKLDAMDTTCMISQVKTQLVAIRDVSRLEKQSQVSVVYCNMTWLRQ